MPDYAYSIILLPKENYWGWVEAARDYVLKFGANLTPDPASAAHYMAPHQTITIAGLPNGYPAQGDIQAWFRTNYPSLPVDYIPAQTPQAFKAVLQTRLEANDQFGQQTAFKLRWPTDYPVITQPFGANPEIYRRWGLPGHEGVDIRAPRGAPVYACADGQVARVDTYTGDPALQPYGNSVRLQHRDGYLTVYAHLLQTLVSVGEPVTAGQRIGYADATGNAAGDHLHLMLKKAGASAAGLTDYPRDILDPTPFLGLPTQPPPVYPWPRSVCLAGLHGRADGPLQDADLTVVRLARIEAVKLMSTARPENVDALRAIQPDMFILVRLMASFQQRVVRPADFVSWLEYDLRQFYARGVRYFELHNEPNILGEGWTYSWQNGREFNTWFLDAFHRFKQLFPEALFGYPGLSPDGVPAPGQRTNDVQFLNESDEAARTADWVGVHCYWQSEAEMEAPGGGRGYRAYRQRYPDKLLFITEFSNVAPGLDKRLKGQQYARYYQGLRAEPGLGAAFAYVASASAGFLDETWRTENGQLTAIPGLVAARAG